MILVFDQNNKTLYLFYLRSIIMNCLGWFSRVRNQLLIVSEPLKILYLLVHKLTHLHYRIRFRRKLLILLICWVLSDQLDIASGRVLRLKTGNRDEYLRCTNSTMFTALQYSGIWRRYACFYCRQSNVGFLSSFLAFWAFGQEILWLISFKDTLSATSSA